MIDIEALVTLETNELLVEERRQDLGNLGLPHPCLTLQE
jgi:hypothetical protein